jgi:hypothetical protein
MDVNAEGLRGGGGLDGGVDGHELSEAYDKSRAATSDRERRGRLLQDEITAVACGI